MSQRMLLDDIMLPPLPASELEIPSAFPMQGQQPMAQPVGYTQQPPQVPPSAAPQQDLGIEILKTYVGKKQEQAQRGSFAQGLIAKRFEPSFDDIAQANTQNTQAALLPEVYRTTTANEVGLAPYSAMARLNGGGGNAPAAVQEYQYYDQLTPEQRLEYLKVKRNPQYLNLGDRFESPATGAVIPKGLPPQDAPALKGAQEMAKTTAEAQGKAQADLPRILDNADYSIKTLEGLRDHPALGDITGLYGAAVPVVPGTQSADALARFKQVTGQNFLEAYNTLKGGGQITEIEGQKATEAIARLDRAQDKQTVQKSINELIGVINVGRNRAKAKAGNVQYAPQEAAPPASGGWSIERVQ